MPITQIEFKKQSDINDVLQKLVTYGVLEPDMSVPEVYEALKKQLIVTTEGDTYLRAELLNAQNEELECANLKIVRRNDYAFLLDPATNKAELSSHKILTNAALAKALSEIYANRGALNFSLPTQPNPPKSLLVQPGLYYSGEEDDLLSSMNVDEYRLNADQTYLLHNHALDDLIWLHFNQQRQVKDEEVEPLLADIRKMKKAIADAQSTLEAKRANTEKKLSEFPVDDSLSRKSDADLERMHRDSLRKEEQIQKKYGRIDFALNTFFLSLILITMVAFVVVPPVAVSFTAFNFCLGAFFGSMGLTLAAIPLFAKLERDEQAEIAKVREDRSKINVAINYKKACKQASVEKGEISKRESLYGERLHTLEQMERSLDKRKPVVVSLATGSALYAVPSNTPNADSTPQADVHEHHKYGS